MAVAEKRKLEEDMLDCVNDLIIKDDDLINLKNCIEEGKINNNYYMVMENVICDDNNQDRLTFISSSWIRFVNMNSRFISEFDKLYENELDKITKDVRLSKINGLNIKNQSILSKGINIDSDLKLSGYHLNIMDILKLVPVKNNYPLSSNQYDSILNKLTNSIYKIMFVGDKNYIIAIVDGNGIMYVNKNICVKIFLLGDKKQFQRIIKNIMLLFSQINSTVISRNMSVLKSDITKPLVQDLVSNYLKNIDIEYVNQKVFDLFKDENNKIDLLINQIEDYISHKIDLYLENTCWGKDFKYSYKNIISDILRRQRDIKRNAATKAFQNGLRIGSKFEMYGWSITTTDAICSSESVSVFWKKTVNIRPDKFCCNGKICKVNDDMIDDIPFCIHTLYLSSTGHLYAYGEHPNVDSSCKVCMGDLSGKIEVSDIDNIGENLRKLENLLYLINYDSSYTCKYIDWYRSNSHLIDTTAEMMLEHSREFEPEGSSVCSEITYMDEE